MTTDNFNLQGIGMTSQRTRNRLVQRLKEKGISNDSVLNAILNIPRHIFIDEAISHRAYEDTALPIGAGQTISQPYIVARMTEVILNAIKPKSILEIGTGCGYQTSILSQVVDKVYSIERIEQLQLKAKQRFDLLGLNNIECLWGDGFEGWSQKGPFDAIIVTASPEKLPQKLIEQLNIDGCMITPLGGQHEVQKLKLFQKTEHGIDEMIIEDVKFVPLLTGKI
jgi:protein-L-isoaspartate(D-aspartate) O-methyltransferase